MSLLPSLAPVLMSLAASCVEFNRADVPEKNKTKHRDDTFEHHQGRFTNDR